MTIALVGVLPSTHAGGWSGWTRGECHARIEYRVRHVRPAGEDRHEWTVELRNRYRERAFFNWTLAPREEPKPRAYNRADMRAGGTLRRNTISEVNARGRVKVFVDRLRLGQKDSPEPGCDAKK